MSNEQPSPPADSADSPSELLRRLKNATLSLERAMAAYGHLMAAVNGEVELPTLIWPATDGDSPIEVHTDLNQLVPEARGDVLNAMAIVHGAEIHKSLTIIGQQHARLSAVLTPAPEAPAPAAPVPAE